MANTTLIAAAMALVTILGATHFMSSEAPRMLSSEEQAIKSAWTHWKMQHGKSYGTDSEESYRATIFKVNYKKIKTHNATPGMTSSVALNKFADLDTAEFKRQYAKGLLPKKNLKSQTYKKLSTNDLPESVNWNEAGAMVDVKDQGQCGSCWAFSAVATIEAANFIEGNQTEPVSLSEQQLVDCAGGQWANHGCNGGLMDFAYDYVEVYPLNTTADYPYTARDGTCHVNDTDRAGTVSTYTDVEPLSETQLMAAIAQQPVAVAIEADTYVFQFYNDGIITSQGCGTSLDHGVTAVGYGTEEDRDYFLVRNSWGADWGESGHVRIARANNICGILSQPSYPTA